MEPVMSEYSLRCNVPVAGVHGHAIAAFEGKADVPLVKHKSSKVVNIRDFVRALAFDPASGRLGVQMRIVDGATVGIQHVVRAVYGAAVEFPVTRERLYIWSNGVKQNPLYLEWERIQAQKRLMDLTL
jgi:hypothetical protein